MMETGTRMVHIPYKGSGPAVVGLAGGEAHLMFDGLPSLISQLKSGRLRPLAALHDKRFSVFPDVPTVAEAGVPGFATTVWFALFGPANMPPELVNKIHADVSKVLDLPQTKEFFEKNSFERVKDSPAEFARLVERDSLHWKTLIDQVGAKVD